MVMRIPSASAFQPSAIFLSSSAAISKYIEKIGPEARRQQNLMYNMLGGHWHLFGWQGENAFRRSESGRDGVLAKGNGQKSREYGDEADHSGY